MKLRSAIGFDEFWNRHQNQTDYHDNHLVFDEVGIDHQGQAAITHNGFGALLAVDKINKTDRTDYQAKDKAP